MIVSTLTRRSVIRPALGLLRRHVPVLRLGKQVIVTSHRDVVEVLTRDADFTIREINGESIDRINGPFILNMDRGPIYVRDHAMLRATARYDDLERIRELARGAAERATRTARPHGRIEAVQTLTRAVPAEMVAVYFGVPGPDRDTLVRWLRNLFQDAFSNPTDDPFVRAAGLRSAAELKRWALAEIERRRAEGVEEADDVMGRMIARQAPERPWLDDDWVRRNVAGLIVGAVDTISRFSILAIDELLRRPEELAGAARAASEGDLDRVRQYAWEAVRFNPHTPLMARHCAKGAALGEGDESPKSIPAGARVLLGTDAAMFDPAAFPEPGRFRTDRDIGSYLHFGWGLHQCYGLAINMVVVPEILSALLRMRGLRRAPGGAGRVQYDGPFPDRLVLEFD